MTHPDDALDLTHCGTCGARLGDAARAEIMREVDGTFRRLVVHADTCMMQDDEVA